MGLNAMHLAVVGLSAADLKSDGVLCEISQQSLSTGQAFFLVKLPLQPAPLHLSILPE